MPSRRLSYASVAELLDCSTKTVRRLVEKGLLNAPTVYNGLGPRFSEDDVFLYLALAAEGRQGQRLRDSTGQTGTNKPPAKDS